ncbi:MAG TPA: hypothetical protein VF043_16550 [Ktedonobacteraceae bacterium]
MPELPYRPSTRPDAAEHSLLRLLGGVLTFLSILLALLGFIFHQRVPDLILALIVGIFALRVLILWLGAQPQHHQPIAGRSSREWVRYPLPSPPSPPEQTTSSASPDSPTQPLSQLAPEHHLPPAAVAPLAPQLPRSIRPQRPPQAPAFPAQPAPSPQEVQPMSPSPPYTSGPMPSPAPVPGPSRQENWQHDDGNNFMQQRGNEHGTT